MRRHESWLDAATSGQNRPATSLRCDPYRVMSPQGPHNGQRESRSSLRPFGSTRRCRELHPGRLSMENREITVDGTDVTVRYGRIGTKGRSKKQTPDCFSHESTKPQSCDEGCSLWLRVRLCHLFGGLASLTMAPWSSLRISRENSSTKSSSFVLSEVKSKRPRRSV